MAIIVDMLDTRPSKIGPSMDKVFGGTRKKMNVRDLFSKQWGGSKRTTYKKKTKVKAKKKRSC